jgi:ribosomal protein S28E/S33
MHRDVKGPKRLRDIICMSVNRRVRALGEPSFINGI